MMPKARKSNRTVTRMKMKAARLGCGCGIGVGAEDKDSSWKKGDCSEERKKVTEESMGGLGVFDCRYRSSRCAVGDEGQICASKMLALRCDEQNLGTPGRA